MKDKSILIVTEANQKVASGHLFECIACQQELIRSGLSVKLMVNADMPKGLKARIEGDYDEYQTNIQVEEDYLLDYINSGKYSIILFNLREIDNSFIEYLKQHIAYTSIWCIDEWGHRELNADVIINPMIDEYYWNYKTVARLYCGAEYLILPDNLKKYHEKRKYINEGIRIITVSMGGMDSSGTTIKVAKWLLNMRLNFEINLVLGGGFLQEDDLEKVICNRKNVSVYRNIANLYDLFYESDLAICAGGNTLHELAVIGVPTIVIPSKVHEKRNGQAFQRQGFALCCTLAEEIVEEDFAFAFERLKDKKIRESMSRAGKINADGKGAERVSELILDFLLKL